MRTSRLQTLKQYWGKGPVSVRSYFIDDLLIVVMKGGLTTAEETMLEFSESVAVRQFRQIFQNRMTSRLTEMVERLTGREVATYQSQVLSDPPRVCELFFFDDLSPEQGRRETAESQLRGEPIQVTYPAAVEPPSPSGQEQDGSGPDHSEQDNPNI